MQFKLKAPFNPTGDQPQAIEQLVEGIRVGRKHQILLGVTGSGKTFTMANCIAKLQKPTLVISHNKTLAAQLYQEFRDFFPENAVSYFVSYYDYYQPEAYIPQTDIYLEKETEINEEIDKLRLAATTNLLTRRDTIIVASVSAIYNIGSPREYGNFVLDLRVGLSVSRESIFRRLVELQYERARYGFHRGTFRVRGEIIDIYPAYRDDAFRIKWSDGKVKTIEILDPIDGSSISELEKIIIYPAKHYMTDLKRVGDVFNKIRQDLHQRIVWFRRRGKLLEANRLEQRVNFDLEMIEEVGYVNGIENYSRYFDGREIGDPPNTLLDYFREPYGSDWLLFIDESHMTVPQIRGMHRGDRSRKQTLVDYGFRLPAALDNRPLTFEEFLSRISQTIYVSATPAKWEVEMARAEVKRLKQRGGNWKGTGIVEQLIRPTGLVDPDISIRPTKGQILDLIKEIIKRKKRKERVLVTTLTKRMAEDLSHYLSSPEFLVKLLGKKVNNEELPKINYLHSDIATLERSDILDDLRGGVYDVIIGINLLREGLDLPEVSLVAILDADKEGFLRSETSLIQTMGRAARHVNGVVILYADKITGSMSRAIIEVKRRRKIQLVYNERHHITPQSVRKKIRRKIVEIDTKKNEDNIGLSDDEINQLLPDERKNYLKRLKRSMNQAAKELNFELAAKLRDQMHYLKRRFT